MPITRWKDKWYRFIDILDPGDNLIYKLNRNLLKNHPLSGPNGQIFSAKEKVEIFASIYINRFIPNTGPELSEVNIRIIIDLPTSYSI